MAAVTTIYIHGDDSSTSISSGTHQTIAVYIAYSVLTHHVIYASIAVAIAQVYVSCSLSDFLIITSFHFECTYVLFDISACCRLSVRTSCDDAVIIAIEISSLFVFAELFCYVVFITSIVSRFVCLLLLARRGHHATTRRTVWNWNQNKKFVTSIQFVGGLLRHQTVNTSKETWKLFWRWGSVWFWNFYQEFIEMRSLKFLFMV